MSVYTDTWLTSILCTQQLFFYLPLSERAGYLDWRSGVAVFQFVLKYRDLGLGLDNKVLKSSILFNCVLDNSGLLLEICVEHGLCWNLSPVNAISIYGVNRSSDIVNIIEIGEKN